MSFWAKFSVGVIAAMVIGTVILLSSAYRSAGVRLSGEEMRRKDISEAARILCDYRLVCGSIPPSIEMFPAVSCDACKTSSVCNTGVMFLSRLSKPDLGFRGTTYETTRNGALLTSEPTEAGLTRIAIETDCH